MEGIEAISAFEDSTEIVEKQPEYVIEAYQIVRVKNGTIAKCTREILDTIMVANCNGSVEVAQRRALHKAKRIGDCFVVEKVERVVECFYQDEKRTNEDDDE